MGGNEGNGMERLGFFDELLSIRKVLGFLVWASACLVCLNVIRAFQQSQHLSDHFVQRLGVYAHSAAWSVLNSDCTTIAALSLVILNFWFAHTRRALHIPCG